MPKVFAKKPKPQAQPSGADVAGAGGAKKLFTPEQVQKATKDYGSAGQAKWNQILSNMGAAGGTGTDLSGTIQSQAEQLGTQLGGLTEASGYGADGMGQLPQILKALEGSIGAKYPVY